MKTRLIGAGVVLALSTLAGCGGSGEYCTLAADAKETVQSYEGDALPSRADLDKTKKVFADLAAAAPDEIADDWKALNGAVTATFEAFEGLDLTDEDLEALKGGDRSVIDEEKMQNYLTALGTMLQSIDVEELKSANENVKKYTQDECDVDFG